MTPDQISKCAAVVEQTLDSIHPNDAWIFRDPWCPYVFPEHTTVCRDPISFSDILDRLGRGFYRDPGDFESECHRMFRNFIAYFTHRRAPSMGLVEDAAHTFQHAWDATTWHSI